MLASDQVEELICLVSAMDRPALVTHISDYEATFPIDFTAEFLQSVPLDRLRHIFLALCLQQHIPTGLLPVAA
jgi:hypothetical protein